MTLLQVQGVSKHFGSLIALSNISMTVEPGELRAIIGDAVAEVMRLVSRDLDHARLSLAQAAE